jgi:hypothetical protein
MQPAMILVYALAVARVTRLITSDKITERPRLVFVHWRYRKAHPWIDNIDKEMLSPFSQAQLRKENLRLAMEQNPPPLLAYMAMCPWCVSIYAGAITAPIVWFWGTSPWLVVPGLALAFSYLAGFLAQHEG